MPLALRSCSSPPLFATDGVPPNVEAGTVNARSGAEQCSTSSRGYVLPSAITAAFTMPAYRWTTAAARPETKPEAVAAEVIANSRAAGYFVTPLFHDDRLIDAWLRGEAVALQKLGG